MSTEPFDAAAAARVIESTSREVAERTEWPERRFYLAQGLAFAVLFTVAGLCYGSFAVLHPRSDVAFLLFAVGWAAAFNLPLLTARRHGRGVVGETPWRERLATRALVIATCAGLVLGEAAAWRVERASGDAALASVLISACVLLAYGVATACGAATYGFAPRLLLGSWWMTVAAAAVIVGGRWGYPVLVLGGLGTVVYALLPHARLDDVMRGGTRG